MRFLLVVPLLASLAGATPAPEGEWEQFPDGSTGQVTEFTLPPAPDKPTRVVFNDLESVLCEMRK